MGGVELDDERGSALRRRRKGNIVVEVTNHSGDPRSTAFTTCVRGWLRTSRHSGVPQKDGWCFVGAGPSQEKSAPRAKRAEAQAAAAKGSFPSASGCKCQRSSLLSAAVRGKAEVSQAVPG